MQLEPTEFYRRNFVVLDTVGEEEILKIFEGLSVLPSSEIFFFAKETDGIVVKQS